MNLRKLAASVLLFLSFISRPIFCLLRFPCPSWRSCPEFSSLASPVAVRSSRCVVVRSCVACVVPDHSRCRCMLVHACDPTVPYGCSRCVRPADRKGRRETRIGTNEDTTHNERTLITPHTRSTHREQRTRRTQHGEHAENREEQRGTTRATGSEHTTSTALRTGTHTLTHSSKTQGQQDTAETQARTSCSRVTVQQTHFTSLHS